MKSFDVIIIGSGLGGLLCAHILSKEGMNVCVIEKNNQIGGCLQTFKRNGCVFDTGVHYIGSLDEGQITNRFFKYFGLMDRLNLKRMDEEGFDVLDLNGERFKYPMGYDRMIDSLRARFPKEQKAIVDYVEQMNKVIDSLDLYNLRIPESTLSLNPYFSTNFAEYLASITNNPQLQNVLAGLNFLYAGDKRTTSLYLHATVIHSFISSAWRPVDGSSQIADILMDDILEFGGTILKDSKVHKLNVEDGVVTYAELINGEQLTADKFISNTHPTVTLDLIDNDKIRKPYRERIHNLDNTTSSFTIYACLHENAYPYENFNHYRINSNSVWQLENDAKVWPQGYMFLTPASSESDQYANCAIIMTFMDFREVERWQDTTINKRGEDYAQFKQEKAELLLDSVEEIRPGFRKHIKKYYTSSPLTFRDYTGTKNGSIYGIAHDCNNPIRSYVPVRTKISNLFFTGQNIGNHGVLGVTAGSIQTCAEFFGMEYLIKQIRAAS